LSADRPLGRLRWRRLRVLGPSMAPTLRHGDVVLVRRGGAVRIGDVVVVRWAARPGQLSVKRARHPAADLWFVTGDNPIASTDSRELGPAAVLGVIRWRLWPRPGRLGQASARSCS
jgi:phage repressor protein C with HTH and peptisase S24 domain